VSWSRVRGHEALARSFADVVARDRLGHAYLFTGPAGVGKKLFARELAKAVLCESPKDPLDACDRCPSCILVEAGTHPDVIFACRPEDKVEFPIDTIRELTETLAMKPARGGYKFAIVDNVDDFNDAAANAFLKTLEEPPPKSVVILLVTDPEGQLPTILSRCQLVRFAPLPAALVTDLLRARDVEPARAELLGRVSGGSLGQALELSDPELWDFRRTLLAELANPKLDTVALAKKYTAFYEEAGKEAGVQRRRAALVLKLLLGVLDDALRVSAGGLPDAVEPGDRAAVQAVAQRLGTERLLKLIDRCLAADFQIDRKVQLVLVVEALADSLNATN
jgi:DNA polymerase-3 subunit delta'